MNNNKFDADSFISPDISHSPVYVWVWNDVCTCEIIDEQLAENNKLKITVTNTSANWYAHTDYFKKWEVKELSPYFEAELDFAKDLVSGGLSEPVTLYT